MKAIINLGTIIIGLVGYLFGGWTVVLQTLVFLMAVDYITGVLAAVFKKSTKTKSGGLSSKAGWKGLVKKFLILCICAITYRIDVLLKAEGLLYNMVCLFYISNEGISILENAIALNLPVPEKLRAVMDSMKEEKDER